MRIGEPRRDRPTRKTASEQVRFQVNRTNLNALPGRKQRKSEVPPPVDLQFPTEKAGPFDADRQSIRDAGLSATFILTYPDSPTRSGQPMTAAPEKTNPLGQLNISQTYDRIWRGKEDITRP